MTPSFFEIRLCQNCGLRYPLTENHSFGERCPNCLGVTETVLTRQTGPEPAPVSTDSIIQLEVLLDNIRSAWNVGSIFRTADGLGIRKLYLCGITPTPVNESVRKTSLGAEENLQWEYARNGLDMSKKLITEGRNLIAIEQDERATPLPAFHFDVQGSVLILGNEVTGVDPEILDLCNQIFYIPMLGKKRSFNVEVAFAIAAYHVSKM